jgi:hypothetical protein
MDKRPVLWFSAFYAPMFIMRGHIYSAVLRRFSYASLATAHFLYGVAAGLLFVVFEDNNLLQCVA